MTLEDRIRAAEAELFSTTGVSVDETFLDLARTGLRVRLLSHGSGPPLLLLHGVSLSAAVWAPLFGALPGRRCSRSTFRVTGCRTPSSTGAVRSASTRVA